MLKLGTIGTGEIAHQFVKAAKLRAITVSTGYGLFTD